MYEKKISGRSIYELLDSMECEVGIEIENLLSPLIAVSFSVKKSSLTLTVTAGL